MKSMLIISSLLISLGAMAKAPVCSNIGSKSEGWITSDGILHWTNCSKQALACEKDEWVSYKLITEQLKLVAKAKCSKSEEGKPVCSNVGSRSEGWKVNGELHWDNCSDKGLICEHKGTKAEGWYASDKDLTSRKVIQKGKCK